MKKCSKCKKKKPIAEFNFKKKSLGIKQSACKHCTRKQIKEHYEKNKEYYLEKSRKRNKKQRDTIKKYIYKYLSERKCVDCGENNPVVLEFDHKSDKKMEISKILQKNYPLAILKEEILKCEIRCANCHRIKTAKDFDWYKYKHAPVA